MRSACLLVPDLPLRAELRARPELVGLPLVVTSGPGNRAQVLAASPEAIALGVNPPCSLTRARSLCPEAQVRATSPVSEQAARDALLDVGFSCAPRAALAPRAGGPFVGEAAVFIDAQGVAKLFGSEAGFASALAARGAAVGLPGPVAIARSRSVAHWMSRSLQCRAAKTGAEPECRVLRSEDETGFLAPLPIDLLDPPDRVAQILTRLGVHRVGDLLRLPKRSLSHRLGPEGLQLVARARGEEVELPLPEASPRWVSEGQELDFAIDRLEPLGFVLQGVLARLLERLALRALACTQLELRLELAGGGRDVRRIGAAAPTRDPRVWIRLLQVALEKRPPEAPVDAVRIAAEGTPLRRDQLDLFRPRGPDPAVLDRTLAELESLCGEQHVGAPQVADGHCPRAFAVVPFRPRKAGRALRERSPAPDSSPTLSVRALRPAVAARVRVSRGSPEWIESSVASGAVVQSAGPWRTTGHWWSEKRFAFDHYDVQISDGTVLRLAFDFLNRRWQIDALYD